MAVRTRKSSSTLPSEPVVDPAAAPTRRRVPGTRSTTTRRPATSSRTLRPILPPEAPAAAEPTAELVPEPIAPPVAEPTAEQIPEPITPPVAEPIAEPVPETVAVPVAEPIAAPVAAAVPVVEAVPENDSLWAIPEPEPEVPVVLAVVAEAVTLPALPTEVLIIAKGELAEVPVEVRVVIEEIPAPETTAAEVAPTAEVVPTELPAVAPAAALPQLVEQLQADVRVLQSLVTGHTEQTVHELSRTTMQMVRMVTGVAHHLDQLAEQVQQLSGVAQTLAKALTRVESTVATLHARAQDQSLMSARGPRELQDALAPVLSELCALRAQDARNTNLERLEQFRAGVELKQLRQAIEKHGPTPELISAVPRPKATRPKR